MKIQIKIKIDDEPVAEISQQFPEIELRDLREPNYDHLATAQMEARVAEIAEMHRRLERRKTFTDHLAGMFAMMFTHHLTRNK